MIGMDLHITIIFHSSLMPCISGLQHLYPIGLETPFVHTVVLLVNY